MWELQCSKSIARYTPLVFAPSISFTFPFGSYSQAYLRLAWNVPEGRKKRSGRRTYCSKTRVIPFFGLGFCPQVGQKGRFLLLVSPLTVPERGILEPLLPTPSGVFTPIVQ